jgi:hypothetical protein
MRLSLSLFLTRAPIVPHSGEDRHRKGARLSAPTVGPDRSENIKLNYPERIVPPLIGQREFRWLWSGGEDCCRARRQAAWHLVTVMTADLSPDYASKIIKNKCLAFPLS